MTTRQVDVGELKEGRYVVIDGVACIIKSMQKSKAGKHGHAKCRLEAIGIIDGSKKIIIKPAHDKIDVPIVEKKGAQVLSVHGDMATVMDSDTYETFDLKISEKLLKTTNSKIAVIRGIFDTDGCIHISKRNYPMINITTTSVPLAKQIQEILVELGFSCSIYVDEIKKKRKKAAYRINIYGKEQILKWKNLIGSSNPNRIKKIATVAQIT